MEQILKSRYRTGEKISENHFSVTYKGFFIGTDKPVVIKIYKRGTLNSSLIREMKQKVKDFSIINHPNIAKILDGDYGWQGFYFVREFIDGESVQDIQQRGEKIGVEKAVTIADQVLAALELTHAKKMIHAALKPSNIFIDQQGIVKVADFVIESAVKDALPQKTMEVMQNAKFTSPEEIAGGEAGPSSDLFSLGIILYEMATGRSIVQDGLIGNLNKLKRPITLDPESASLLPRYLADIIRKAINFDPILRFNRAEAFRAALENKTLPSRRSSAEEFIKIFENTVTQYGGEELDQERVAPQDAGRVHLRWHREKHRNWILSAIVAAAVAIGLLYAFFLGR